MYDSKNQKNNKKNCAQRTLIQLFSSFPYLKSFLNALSKILLKIAHFLTLREQIFGINFIFKSVLYIEFKVGQLFLCFCIIPEHIVASLNLLNVPENFKRAKFCPNYKELSIMFFCGVIFSYFCLGKIVFELGKYIK